MTDLLQMPGEVGSSEYRAIFQCLEDAALDATDEQEFAMVNAICDEFISHAEAVKETLEQKRQLLFEERGADDANTPGTS